MANNYTDLKNNYMYGYKNRLNNFYQNYKNFENDLDDPIFTGFTFHINMEQSPLFQGGTSYSGTSGGSGLSSQIQTSLKNKHVNRDTSNYAVTTTTVDKINSSKIGYGNQTNIYSEGVDYNAIEYIYMVDRVLGIDSFNSTGTSSLSSSTKTQSQKEDAILYASKAAVPTTPEQTKAYNQAAKLAALQDKIDADNDSATSVNEAKKQEKLNEKKAAYAEKNQNYIDSIATKFTELNDEYTKAKDEYEKKWQQFQDCNQDYAAIALEKQNELNAVEKIKDLVSASSSILEEYISLKISLADTQKSLDDVAKGTNTDSSTKLESDKKGIEESLDALKSKAANIASSFEKFKSNYSADYNDLTASIDGISIQSQSISDTAYDAIKSNLAASSEYKDKSIESDWLKSSDYTSILSLAYCNYDAADKINTINETLGKLRTEANKLQSELYGCESSIEKTTIVDGSPVTTTEYTGLGTPDNPSDTSLYGKAKQSREELIALKNSEEMQILSKASDEIDAAMSSFDETTNVISSLSNNPPQSNNEYDTDDDDGFVSQKSDENNDDTIYTQNSADRITQIVPDDETLKSMTTSTNVSAPQTCIDLIGFINGMKKLTDSYPYIFQSVTGLDDAYKNYFKMSEPFQGSGENKITINCYESVDMKVSAMFNKYFNAVYDREYKRERLPMNLRRFNCSIFVHDIRNFRHALNLLYKDKNTFGEDADNVSNIGMIAEIALNHLSAIEFKFFDCEISQDDTGGIFDTINNADLGEQRMTKFSFTYGNCYINFLPFADLVTKMSTSGKNDGLANEKNIVTATRKVEFVDGVTKKSSQKTEDGSTFEEEEKKIPYISNSLTKNIVYEQTDSSKSQQRTKSGEEDVEDLYMDDIDVYDDYSIDNNNRKLTTSDGYSNNLGTYLDYNGRRVSGVIGNVNYGEGYYYDYVDYLGNVEYDDFDEAIEFRHKRNPYQLNYDERQVQLAEERALDMAMQSLSASTGYTKEDIYNKLGLGNVYKDIRTSGEETSNSLTSSYNVNTGNVKLKDDKLESDETDKHLREETDTAKTNYKSETTRQSFNSENLTYRHGDLTNTDMIGTISGTEQSVTYSTLNEDIDKSSNKDYTDVFSNADAQAFSVNDIERGTSITDYVLSENTNDTNNELTDIGMVYEKIKISDDELSNGEMNPTDIDNEEHDTLKSIGTISMDNEASGVTKSIDGKDDKPKETGYTEELGTTISKTNGDIELYKSEQNVYGIENNEDIKETSDIGVVNQFDDNAKDLENIGKLANDIKVSQDVKEINVDDYKKKAETEIYKSSNIDDDTLINDKNVVEGLGKIISNEINVSNSKSLGKIDNQTKQSSTYISEKINTPSNDTLEYVKKIGKVITGDDKKVSKEDLESLDNLNDLTI